MSIPTYTVPPTGPVQVGRIDQAWQIATPTPTTLLRLNVTQPGTYDPASPLPTGPRFPATPTSTFPLGAFMGLSRFFRITLSSTTNWASTVDGSGIKIYLVGGGGGGGYGNGSGNAPPGVLLSSQGSGGGGGGGGYVPTTASLVYQTVYPITIGAGGAGSSTLLVKGQTGGDTITPWGTAKGGGGGGAQGTGATAGLPGASGGGGGTTTGAAGAAITSGTTGYPGAAGQPAIPAPIAGGGGGYSAAASGGNGGAGVVVANIYPRVSGGGGGGSAYNQYAGAGGAGGANGGGNSTPGGNANFYGGGGGGGGGTSVGPTVPVLIYPGGNGSPGVVFIQWP